MSNEQTDAKVLEIEIMEAVEKFEAKTGIAVEHFIRNVVWDYDSTHMRYRPVTTSIEISYRSRLG